MRSVRPMWERYPSDSPGNKNSDIAPSSPHIIAGTNYESATSTYNGPLSNTYYSTDSTCSASIATVADFSTVESDFSSCSSTCENNFFCKAFTYEPNFSGTNCFMFIAPLPRLTMCTSQYGALSGVWDY